MQGGNNGLSSWLRDRSSGFVRGVYLRWTWNIRWHRVAAWNLVGWNNAKAVIIPATGPHTGGCILVGDPLSRPVEQNEGSKQNDQNQRNNTKVILSLHDCGSFGLAFFKRIVDDSNYRPGPVAVGDPIPADRDIQEEEHRNYVRPTAELHRWLLPVGSKSRCRHQPL